MTSKYHKLNMEGKGQYQKFHSADIILKSLAILAVSSEEDIQAVLDIRPCEVYQRLTGKQIGEKYLNAIIDADLSDWEKTALQLSKVWQDVKMPIRKLLQWRHNDKTMVRRFKEFLSKF